MTKTLGGITMHVVGPFLRPQYMYNDHRRVLEKVWYIIFVMIFTIINFGGSLY